MQVLLFGLNGAEYGVFLKDVEFISEKVNIVKAPDAPELVSGVATLRGETVPVYNLASRFGYVEQETRCLVVVKVDDFKLALGVGTINRVVRMETAAVMSLPLVGRTAQSCFQDVFACGGNLIGLLDINELIPKQHRKEIRLFIEKNIEEITSTERDS